MGFVMLICWIALALVFIAFGNLCENEILLGIGAVMVLMTAMVSEVSW